MGRLGLVLSILTALAADASADAKLDQALAGYVKEAASCRVHDGGLAKTLAGVTRMLQAAHDDELVAAARVLQKDHDVVAAYCVALDGAVAILQADPSATYKSVEKALDEQDNKIRPLRKPAQAAYDDAAPLIAKLIPRINAARTAFKEPAKLPTTFPSGHKVKLPAWAGNWKLSGTHGSDTAEYTEAGVTISLTVNAFKDATCDQQLGMAERNADKVTTEKSEVKGERYATTLAWLKGTEFRATYAADGRNIQLECVPTKAGGIAITLDQSDKLQPVQDVSDVAAQMLAAMLADK